MAPATMRAPGACGRIESEVLRAKQALENQARVDLRRHGCRRASPGYAVGVGAAIARVTITHGA